ncbi:MAG TPA: hypothetical protein VG738_04285 [Chitinophagaceae bacterium]|nr:hypothetical protein [Chitinophagaceae bacterium]
MKKSPKNDKHELPWKESEKDNDKAKDYAHYPPAPAKQVKPAADKNTKNDKVNNNSTPIAPVQEKKTGDEKILNGSRKIVNETDESYSDGSGGGFEATEQVNE